MIKSFFLCSIILGVLGFSCGARAAGSGTTGAADLPLRYINPTELPRADFSFAVSAKSWVPQADVHVNPSDLKAGVADQLASALGQLDRVLAIARARRHAIIRLKISFANEESGGFSVIEDMLHAYLSVRDGSMMGVDGGVDYPIRTIIKVRSLGQPNQKISLDVGFVDRAAIPSDLILDLDARRRAGGEFKVFFGNVTAQQADMSVAGFRDPRAETIAALKNLEAVLQGTGAGIGDVRRLTVYLAYGSAISRQAVQDVLNDYVKAAHFAVAADISVQPALAVGPGQARVMIDGEALAKSSL